MALSKQFLNRVRRLAESQGAVVTNSRGGGLRIKTPEGRVLKIHATPSRPEVYRLSLMQNFRKIGLQGPDGGFR